MSLDLDPRQRAMLHEMGVRVWQPETPSTPTGPLARGGDAATPDIAIINKAISSITTTDTTQNSHSTRGAMPLGEVTSSAASAAPNPVADGDWQALVQTVAACQDCALCEGRRAPVFGATPALRPAHWLLVGEPPDDDEERAGTPFVALNGQLLDNMLKAVGVSRSATDGDASTTAYVTNVVKCRPAMARNPTPQELAACERYLHREVALVQPRVILAMGRFAAQTLLQGSVPDATERPLGQLRGQVYRYQDFPVVVTYPTSYLLRTPQAKARAWADLCLALETAQRAL